MERKEFFLKKILIFFPKSLAMLKRNTGTGTDTGTGKAEVMKKTIMKKEKTKL